MKRRSHNTGKKSREETTSEGQRGEGKVRRKQSMKTKEEKVREEPRKAAKVKEGQRRSQQARDC